MFNKVAILLLVLSALAACAMAPNQAGFVQYNGHNLLSEQSAKSLQREQRLAAITEQMKTVGFDHVRVSYLFDKYSHTVLGIFENQYQLINEHKTLLDNHKDVMSFLMANQDKNQAELQREIERFDLHLEQQDKIAPKIKAYQRASDKIWRENTKLAAQIALQALELSLVVYQASQTDDGVGELILINMLEMMVSANKLNKAAELAKIRLHLAKLANNFIEDEQAIIDITKRLQEYQEQQP